MKAVFTAPFGNYVPGDEIELPDGCIYDGSYLKPVEDATPAKADKADSNTKDGDK